MSSASTPARAGDQSQQRRSRSFPERVTFGIASTILLAIVGLVLYDWLITPAQPPVISVRQNGAVWAAGDQFYVPFTIENTGGNTAEAVQVIAELEIDGAVVEEGEQQIDFLAGSETEEGTFIFSQDPRQGELTLRVASYKEP